MAAGTTIKIKRKAGAFSGGELAAGEIGLDTTTGLLWHSVDGSSVSAFGVPIGAIVHVAQNTAPAGYLKANGAAISRTTYAALFAAIGTTFGVGDGSTTFNLPDLRGEFVRGWDDSRGVDSGRSFGSWQTDEFKSHSHTGSYSGAWFNGANGNWVVAQISVNTGATGGVETRPRNVALLACIKF